MSMRRFWPFCVVAAAVAQAPEVPIHEDPGDAPTAEERRITTAAEELRAAGKLLDFAAVRAQFDRRRCAVAVPAPARQSLNGPQLFRRARSSYVRIGLHFKCRECDDWHQNLGGGYAIADGGVVATCHHVLVPDDDEMREGYLIAVEDSGAVHPVLELMASDAGTDVAILRTTATALAPLPLRTDVVPGEAAFVYSDPMTTRGFFSAGIVNRFAYEPVENGDGRRIIMNVSTDWAPGSSGAAVLDGFGNAIGHVATIATHGEAMGEEGADAKVSSPGRETFMVLHAAARAADVLALVEAPPTAPVVPPAAKPTGSTK
jgi:S1-C subfamily serine protease